MHPFSTLLITLFACHRVLAQTSTTLAYDTVYDDASLSLNDVACSTGTNGLETKGYTTLGSLPDFPYVGGAYTVTGYNSPACGTCYAVTYNGNTINVLAVDVSTTGFTVSEEAMNALTGGLAVELGRVAVTSVETSPSACGLA